VAGAALLLAYGAAQWHFARLHRTGLQEFANAAGQMQDRRIEPPISLRAAAPDTSSWSAGRISAYEAEAHSAAPQAVLRIPSIALEVPIYTGATEANLNRGAAWIKATAPLGRPGNTGLAAHRDGYFRALRHIAIGDRIELQTLLRTQVYWVDDIRIVEPAEVQVLAPTSDERLTLVTCYPFYVVGPAPKRYIVRARPAKLRDAS
jgi:sortase A